MTTSVSEYTNASPPSPLSLVEKIEHSTRQTLSIESALTDENLARCNPQWQSPLFQLPQELRHLIFLFASTQSPDLRYKYNENAYHWRPDHVARLKTCTSLLSTCRRVWLEANNLPMREAEHAFWFQRGPYDAEPDKRWPINIKREQQRYENFLRRLTSANIADLRHVHLFMQTFQAEQFLNHYVMDTLFPVDQLRRGLRPKVLRVTLRHCDWADWEIDRALYLKEEWVQAILHSPQLSAVQEFKLELEVWEKKKDQLATIIESLSKLEGKFKLTDPTNREFQHVTKFVFKAPVTTWQWVRSPRIDNQDWPVYEGVSELKLHVALLTWRNVTFPADSKALQTANSAITAGIAPPENSFFPTFFPRPRQTLRSVSIETVAHHVRQASAEMAEAAESVRRERFARLMGDVEAKRLMKEWEAKGSLLRLESGELTSTARPHNRQRLDWLNHFMGSIRSTSSN